MNLPNKLTCLRVIMIPFCLFFLMTSFVPQSQIIALIIFLAASFTDFLDGKIARSRNLVTNFGKFMDPLADKLLVCSVLICFVAKDRIPFWIVIIIIAREFIISGFRLIASDSGIVIAASWWGKTKTVTQMALIILLMLNIPVLHILEIIVMYIALILTVVSLVDYIAKNRQVLTHGGM